MKTQTLPMGLEEMIEDAAGIGACFKSPISQQKGVHMFLGLLLLAYFHPTERTHKHHIATGVPGHLITASSFRHVADSHRHPSRIPMDSLLTWTQLLPPNPPPPPLPPAETAPTASKTPVHHGWMHACEDV